MDIAKVIWNAKAGIAALVLLGIAELLVIDVAGISIKVSVIGGGIFIIISPIIGILAVLAIGWEAVKRSQWGNGSIAEGAKTGALVAFAASLAVDAAILVLSLMDRGVAKLFPTPEWGAYQVIAHVAILSLVPLAYAVLGAMAGAAAVYIAKKNA